MILVLNPGSSSLKYKVYDQDLREIARGNFSNIGSFGCKNHREAIEKFFKELSSYQIDLIGIRVVHGGDRFSQSILIDDDVVRELVKCSKLAPLHNPPALETIYAIRENQKQLPVYAVFDTSFYADLPEEAFTYALPEQITKSLSVRRYGFHGISHSHAMKQVPGYENKKIISIHLGGGCSITAINNGKPIDTSMGFTPDEGLVMQTRSGDIDPGIIFHLAEKYGLEKAKNIIEKESGLKGLTATDGEMLSVLYLAGEEIVGADFNPDNLDKNPQGKENARLALMIYCNRIKKYIGAYAALLSGLDAVVFTGMIGANSPVIREKVMVGLDFLGNFEVMAINPDEELAIAEEVRKLKP